MLEKSIFNNIKCDQDKNILLEELETELLQIPHENADNYKNNINFCFSNNQTMIQAELYHLCKLARIKCYLEMKTVNSLRHSRFDAVINVNGSWIIIEIKLLLSETFDSLVSSVKFEKQINKYQKLGLPILLITDKCDLKKIMILLRDTYFLENKVYFLNFDKLSPLSLYNL